MRGVVFLICWEVIWREVIGRFGIIKVVGDFDDSYFSGMVELKVWLWL